MFIRCSFVKYSELFCNLFSEFSRSSISLGIIKITNSKSEIQFLEERAGDIKHSQANPEKFNTLGFKPDFTIQAALEETILFYNGWDIVL